MTEKTKASNGLKYSLKTAKIICARLCDGETLTSICRDLGMRPSTVYAWTRSHPEFAERFARARDFGDAVLEDAAIDYADDECPQTDTIETESDDRCGTTRKRFDNVARSRLMAETRLKVVARRKGGKVTAEIRVKQKAEADAAAAMTTDQLLEIARMKDDEGETE